MHVHPAIAALRANSALQRRAQGRLTEAHDEWTAKAATKRLQKELRQFGEGKDLATLPSLDRLLTGHETADQMVRDYTNALIAALRIEPLGEVPLRHTSSDCFARLQLMEQAGAVISLCVYEPNAKAMPPRSVQFTDCEVHELILAGEAEGQVHYLEEVGNSVSVRTNLRVWTAGRSFKCQPQKSARQVLTVSETLLLLQLTRTPEKPRPTQEFSLPDGTFIRQISGDKASSEQVMALSVLGALGDMRALEVMEMFGTDRDNDHEARWEAMRQVLAMDSQRGMRMLGELTAHANDPLCKPAQSLLQQLIEDFPILTEPMQRVS